MIYTAKDEKETIDIGKHFGNCLKKGDVVCLVGDLGAGKTTFTKGIALALNSVYEPVSPTFNIVNEYMGDITIYHFDLYRLLSTDDLYSIDIDSYLFSDGICVIEWPQIAYPILENYYIVDIKYSGQQRTIEINEVNK